MQALRTPAQAHCIKQPNKPEKMIPMQMADHNMLDSAYLCFIPDKLHLASFATVKQEIAVANIEKLTCLMPSVCRSCRVRS